MAVAEKLRPSGRVAFSHPGFVVFVIARWFIVLALEMQSVAVGWQVYDITKKPLDLGLVGLAQFTPSFLLFLVSGHLADRVDRRKLIVLCYIGFATCSGLLLFIAALSGRAILPIYGVVVLSGIVRSFNGPVTRSILPQLVPEEHFANAVAWSSSANQSANILGPSIGGFVYAISRGPYAVYALAMIAGLSAALAMLRIQLESKPRPREPVSFKTVLAGIHYIFNHKVVLGSISLDLVRRPARRRRGVAPSLRARNPEDWPLGPGPAALLAGNWRRDHGHRAGASPIERPRGHDHAVVRRGLRRLHDHVWPFA